MPESGPGSGRCRRTRGRLDLRPVGQQTADAAEEGVLEADSLGAAVDADRRLRALEDDVLEAELDAEPVAQRPMAQAHGQERLLTLQEPVDHREHRTHLGVVGVTQVAGTRPDDDQVGGLEDRAVPLGVVRA